jgi:hypothetical protein
MVALLLVTIPLAARAAAPKTIPVYPGAALDKEDSKPEDCCSFATPDSSAKVIAFYEKALGTKALDSAAFVKRYPEWRKAVEESRRNAPAMVTWWEFVVAEEVLAGTKVPVLFEVVSSPMGVRFNIQGDRLAPDDAKKFTAELRDQAREKAGVRALDPKKLTACLPSSAPSGFERSDQGESGEGDGTEAFSAWGRDKVTVVVRLEDRIADRAGARDLAQPAGPSDKAVKVSGKYPGTESVERNSYGCVGSRRAFLISDRFLVEIKADGSCELSLIDEFMRRMDLGALPAK